MRTCAFFVVSLILFGIYAGSGSASTDSALRSGHQQYAGRFSPLKLAQDYIAGLYLAAASPFSVGDLVTINAAGGYVTNLTPTVTRIVSADGSVYTFRNSVVCRSAVVNYTRSVRSDIVFRTSLTGMSEILEEALNAASGHRQVERSPEPWISVEQGEDGLIDLRLYFWLEPYARPDEVKRRIVEDTMQRLAGRSAAPQLARGPAKEKPNLTRER